MLGRNTTTFCKEFRIIGCSPLRISPDWAARTVVNAELSANDHERIGDVSGRLTKKCKFPALNLSKLFTHGQNIGKHLSRVEFSSQPIPNGNPSFCSKLLNLRLFKAAVFNSVIHAAKDASRVLNRLLFAHLGRARIQISYTHAKVKCTNFEGAASTRGSLLK